MAGLGLPVTDEEIKAEAGGMGAGRPHIAAILVRKGVVRRSRRPSTSGWRRAGRPTSTRSGWRPLRPSGWRSRRAPCPSWPTPSASAWTGRPSRRWPSWPARPGRHRGHLRPLQPEERAPLAALAGRTGWRSPGVRPPRHVQARPSGRHRPGRPRRPRQCSRRAEGQAPDVPGAAALTTVGVRTRLEGPFSWLGPPVLQAAKTAIAAALSWYIAADVIGNTLPVFAPLTAVLTVQVTVLGLGVTRSDSERSAWLSECSSLSVLPASWGCMFGRWLSSSSSPGWPAWSSVWVSKARSRSRSARFLSSY